MPSRAYTSFLLCLADTNVPLKARRVNALSGLYLISTQVKQQIVRAANYGCQCPLGLIPHFYGTPSKT